MQWHQMSKSQQGAARLLRDRLATEGVAETVSQIARHFGDAMAWRDGTLTLAALCERTGWTIATAAHADPLDRVKAAAGRLKLLREQQAAALSDLRKEIAAADAARKERGGERGRNEIARAAADGLSRQKVYELFGVVDVRAAAESVLAGLPHLPVEIILSERQGKVWLISPQRDVPGAPDDEGEDAYPGQEERYQGASDRQHEYAVRHNALGLLDTRLREAGIGMYVEYGRACEALAEDADAAAWLEKVKQ